MLSEREIWLRNVKCLRAWVDLFHFTFCGSRKFHNDGSHYFTSEGYFTLCNGKGDALMKLEEAYYHQLLLMAGLNDDYDGWLDSYLEAEDPLSRIVLDLALCGSDVNKTISCLQSYCGCWLPLDETQLCEKLRLYLKGQYHSGKMDQEAVVNAMHRIADAHGDPGDFNIEIWYDFYHMDDYLDMAKDGIITRSAFDVAFFQFLDDGVPMKDTALRQRKNPSLLEKIKMFWNR